MLLLRSAMRQPRNGNLRLPIKKTPRLLRDAFLSYDNLRQSIPKCPITIISCYVISNKFPRLLAEREIIANAFVYQRCLGNGSSQIQLQRYNNLLKQAHLFIEKLLLNLTFFFFRYQQTTLSMPKYTLFNHNVNKEGIAIIKGVTKTTAQQLAYERTTRGRQPHNS